MTLIDTTSHYFKPKQVHDTLYGLIQFPNLIWQFIETPYFQRLRGIKQLGGQSWIFPGVVHTRFQHCIGTGYLAKKYITTLIETHRDKSINQQVHQVYYTKNNQYISIRQQAIFTITLAGILHDIGHGPFSHVFDLLVMKRVEFQQLEWEHQVASLYLIDAVFDHVLVGKDREQLGQWIQSIRGRVKALVLGKISQMEHKLNEKGQYIGKKEKKIANLPKGFSKIFDQELNKRAWQFEIVSNRLTGIDVDKFDYFRRDAYYLGIKHINIDYDYLKGETLILKQKQGSSKDEELHRLCFSTDALSTVYDIFHSRYTLFRDYYRNLQCYAVECMIAQILTYAEPYFGFKIACKQLLDGKCQKYIRLTDSILERIQAIYDQVKEKQLLEMTEKEKRLVEAGKIIDKLRCRQIYQFIKQYYKVITVSNFKQTYQQSKKLVKQVIKQKKEQSKDFLIQVSEVGCGSKDEDPLTKCRFYNKKEINNRGVWLEIIDEQNVWNNFNFARNIQKKWGIRLK